MGGIVTLGQFFQEHFLPVRLYGAAPSTVESYRGAVSMHARLSGRPMHEWTLASALSYLRQLRDRGLSPATVNKYRRLGLAMIRYANEIGVTQHEWLRRLPKLPESHDGGEAYLLEEVEALLVAARRTTGDVGPVPARAFWPALILVLYDCGSRISATMALRPADVSLDRRMVRFRASTQKQNKTQVKAISNQTAAAVGAMHCPHREAIFPWPFDRNTRQWANLTRHFRAIIDAASLPQPAKPFHKFRCTSGSMFEEFAGSGSQHLGHSSPRIFDDHYKDQRIATGSQSLDKIPRPQYEGDAPRSAWELD